MTLAALSIVASGFNTADKNWFSKFMVPYDVPAIAAEFHMAGAGDHLQVAEGHGEEAHADDHAPADAHGVLLQVAPAGRGLARVEDDRPG